MSPERLLERAATACASARVLLERGDLDGAANRAYYAMFDAARAGLLLAGAPAAQSAGRTHSGLIAAFGLHLVKHGPISKDLGRWLNRAHEMRQIADYVGSGADEQEVAELVQQAERLLADMANVSSGRR